MPASILVPAIASVAGGVGSAVVQSRAAGKAAKETSQAANYAADRQAEAAQRQEQFLREQAQRDYEQQEAVRRANYEQWAAREQRLGSIAERLGYGKRNIPSYVPSVNPGFTGQGQSPQSADGRPVSTTMPLRADPDHMYTMPDGRQVPFIPFNPGPYGPITRVDAPKPTGQTVSTTMPVPRQPPSRPMPIPIGAGPSQPTRTSMPTVPSAREVILARRFPQGSVGASILAARRRSAGVV